MFSFRHIVPAFLLVAVAADTILAPASTRDTREVAAQPVLKQGRNKRSKQPRQKGNEDKKPYGNTGMQRVLAESRTTLLNVDVSSLTTKEYFFFEDTLREAYASVYEVTVNSVIVEQAEKPNNVKKNLRGSGHHNRRALDFFDEPIVYFWFDIYALLEFTCTLCGPDDDDDFYFDDDFNFRKLGKQVDYAAKKTQLEATLCRALQESPFENLQGAQGCEILIV
jgi:hypothetical protein